MNLVECLSLTALVRYTLYMTSSGASSGHVEYYELFSQRGASSGRFGRVKPMEYIRGRIDLSDATGMFQSTMTKDEFGTTRSWNIWEK